MIKMNHENVFYIATTLALQFSGAPNDRHHQLQKISGAGAGSVWQGSGSFGGAAFLVEL